MLRGNEKERKNTESKAKNQRPRHPPPTENWRIILPQIAKSHPHKPHCSATIWLLFVQRLIVLMMEILLATGNIHKKEEFERLLAPHTVIVPRDIGVEFSPEETGTSFLENALIKTNALARSVDPLRGNLPILADDSGLCVPALSGAPGVLSARYGSVQNGKELKSSERNDLLLHNMAAYQGEKRRAFFVCAIALCLDTYRVFTAQETLEGMIAGAPSGTNGFGYDPIFRLPQTDCTVAELDSIEKDRISHRARATKRIQAILESLKLSP